jgi:hypothetical protein
MRQNRPHLVDEVTDCCHYVDILPSAVPANVVGFADATALEHGTNSRAVVFDKQPVAHVLPIAIGRQRLAVERIQNHEGVSVFPETGKVRSCLNNWS